MRLLLAANNQATRRNEIIKSYLQLGSSSNRYALRLPQQETKSSTKQLPPTGPILGPENILKTGFAQKGLPSSKPTTPQSCCSNASDEPDAQASRRCWTRKPEGPAAVSAGKLRKARATASGTSTGVKGWAASSGVVGTGWAG